MRSMDEYPTPRSMTNNKAKRKIALVSPRRGWRPGLGILYCASYLLDAGYDVRVFEFFDENFNVKKNRRVWKEMMEFDADIYGFSVISWNRAVAGEQIRRLREETEGKFIICGGKDPSYMGKYYIEYGADVSVIGEGEETMVELADFVNGKGKLKDILGICFRNEFGEIVETEHREPTVLDNLLFPAFHLIDYSQYTNIRLGGIPGHYIRTGFMMANRGCPFNCKYCSEKVRNVYRERPLKDIVAEIKWQNENWKIDGMVFLDDLFYFDEQRIIDLCNLLKEAGLDKLKYYAQTRVDRTPKAETLKLMYDTGFIQLALGIESGSQRILDIVGKGIKPEVSMDAVTRINDAGIHSYAYMIIGLPEEKEEDLEVTAEFLRELKPTFVAVNYFMPMPGTKYFNEEEDAKLGELSYSLTENQTQRSEVGQEKLAHYRYLFESCAQRSANKNLFEYPRFFAFLAKVAFLRPDVLVKGAWIQFKTRRYSSYFEAMRTAMINYKICG